VADNPRAIVRLEGIGNLKTIQWPHRDSNSHLPACIIASQPSTLLRAPTHMEYIFKIKLLIKYNNNNNRALTLEICTIRKLTEFYSNSLSLIDLTIAIGNSVPVSVLFMETGSEYVIYSADLSFFMGKCTVCYELSIS
jgi:hypothetical protein